jgi:hypothetical protein
MLSLSNSAETLLMDGAAINSASICSNDGMGFFIG